MNTMIVKDRGPCYGAVKNEDPDLEGKDYGINWKIWEYYEKLLNRSHTLCVLSRGNEIITRTKWRMYHGDMRKRNYKVHHLDSATSVTEKCRYYYFKRVYSTFRPLEDMQKSIRSSYDSEPKKLIREVRRKKDRKARIRREREKVASMKGCGLEHVRKHDIMAYRADNIL